MPEGYGRYSIGYIVSASLLTLSGPSSTRFLLTFQPFRIPRVRGSEELDVGDRVRVELLDTNVERGYIDVGSLGRG